MEDISTVRSQCVSGVCVVMLHVVFYRKAGGQTVSVCVGVDAFAAKAVKKSGVRFYY